MSTPASLVRKTKVLMGERRFLVIDSETTGLAWDARILSLSLIDLWPDLLGEAQGWYINPGLGTGGVRIEPKAAALHRITIDHLRDKPPFSAIRDELNAKLLSHDGRPVVLVGHNVGYDWRRILHEHQLLGSRPPEVLLLDTGALAREAGVVCGPRLDHLLKELELAAPARHTATGDALATGQAALLLLHRLAATTSAEDLPSRLESLLQPSTAAKLRGPSRHEPEDPEHQQAHDTDLRSRTAREAALDICLAHACPDLGLRMEDGITTKAAARQVCEWALEYLDGARLNHRVRGRILGGLGKALRRTGDPAYVEDVLLNRLAPLLHRWGRCTPSRQCGRCEHLAGTCRYVDVARQAVLAYVSSPKNPYDGVAKNGAQQFMPGWDPTDKVRRGRPPEGLYQRLRRAKLLDAAGYGAALVAEYRRRTGSRAWALHILQKAWDDGCRTPHLTEQLVSMVIADGVGLDKRGAPADAHLHLALAHLKAGLAEHRSGRGARLDRLRQRQAQLLEQVKEPPVPRQAVRPRNTRPPAATRLGLPPV